MNLKTVFQTLIFSCYFLSFSSYGQKSDYDQNYKIKSLRVYIETQNVSKYFLYTWEVYDNMGMKMVKSYYSQLGHLIQNVVYVTDTLNNVVAYRIYDSLGMLSKEVAREFDEDGRQIINSFSDDLIYCNDKNVKCSYNKQGHIIFYERRSANNKDIVLEKYKYDYEYW